MPFFAYKGRDGRGHLVQGVLEGADSGTIAGQLSGVGVTPLEISPSAEPRRAGPGLLERLQQRKITHSEVLLFSRQMYTLLKAGVPIMGALKGLEESTENRSFSRVVREIRESLDSGRELSASVARHPKVFNLFYISMVRVGELTGTLEEVFIRLFNHLDFERFMREQVRAATRYPTFVIAAMVVAFVIINIFVIPAFAKVYAGFKAELPAMTKMLIALSNFTVTYWPALLAALVVLVFGFRFYISTAPGRPPSPASRAASRSRSRAVSRRCRRSPWWRRLSTTGTSRAGSRRCVKAWSAANRYCAPRRRPASSRPSCCKWWRWARKPARSTT
jgi:MSHA biogenesis protein MshG